KPDTSTPIRTSPLRCATGRAAVDGTISRRSAARSAGRSGSPIPSPTRSGAKYDFLTAEMRAETGIAETIAVSAHGYDPRALQLIEELADGLILDCGAGRRDTYYRNVVNYEIVDYDT